MSRVWGGSNLIITLCSLGLAEVIHVFILACITQSEFLTKLLCVFQFCASVCVQ